jgi:hypothetical protein
MTPSGNWQVVLRCIHRPQGFIPSHFNFRVRQGRQALATLLDFVLSFVRSASGDSYFFIIRSGPWADFSLSCSAETSSMMGLAIVCISRNDEKPRGGGGAN